MRIRKPNKDISVQEIRDQIIKLRTEGKKIISHYKKLDAYYEDWQDRLYKIELAIQEAERETGLDKIQLAEYDALEDALNM